MRCASATSMCTYFAEVGRKRLHFVPGMQVEVGQPRDAELLAQVHHLLRVSVDLLASRPRSMGSTRTEHLRPATCTCCAQAAGTA